MFALATYEKNGGGNEIIFSVIPGRRFLQKLRGND